MKKLLVFLFAFIIVAFMNCISEAVVIDFEPDASRNLPDGTPAVDELAISDQYLASHGVLFAIDNNKDGIPDEGLFPTLEIIGEETFNGFRYDTGGPIDTAASGNEDQLGQFFLKPFAVESGGMNYLLITYETPILAASGQIWDIDGFTDRTEQWSINALDASGNSIDTILSPSGDSLLYDGKPYTFSFDHGTSADIYALRIEFVGTKTPGPRSIGMGFNNFSSVVPEPISILLFGSGLIVLAGVRKKLKK